MTAQPEEVNDEGSRWCPAAPIFIGASIHHRRAGIRKDVDYRLLATAPIIFAVLPIAAGPVVNILLAVLRH